MEDQTCWTRLKSQNIHNLRDDHLVLISFVCNNNYNDGQIRTGICTQPSFTQLSIGLKDKRVGSITPILSNFSFHGRCCYLVRMIILRHSCHYYILSTSGCGFLFSLNRSPQIIPVSTNQNRGSLNRCSLRHFVDRQKWDVRKRRVMIECKSAPALRHICTRPIPFLSRGNP